MYKNKIITIIKNIFNNNNYNKFLNLSLNNYNLRILKSYDSNN